MNGITLFADMLIGIIIGILLPLLWWHIKIYLMTKETLDMHLSPDEFGFGSGKIIELLETGIDNAAERQERQIEVNKGLTRSFRELVHFVRWSAEESTGKKPPPFIDTD